MGRRGAVEEVEVLAVECDEWWVCEAIEEVEEEYGAEELNVMEGIGERVNVGPEGVIVPEVGEGVEVVVSF